MSSPSITPIRESGAKAAIVFVHGFTGSGESTWKAIAPKLKGISELATWDIWTVTYGTSWFPDIKGIWSADADLSILAQRLATDIMHGSLAKYNGLVLIAHSMGGLIVQRALLDFSSVVEKTGCVILFGTPSDGLKKASLFGEIWKPQLRDMVKGGAFVSSLRSNWKAKWADTPPFHFLAVAGEKDQFVPPESSLGPFAKDQQAVIAGNHVSMLDPASGDNNIFDLIKHRIVDKKDGDVGDSALRMIERGEFQRIVDERFAKADTLDRKALIQLAIALDALGRRHDAFDVLSKNGDLDSDALGVMGGRLKRKWLLDREKAAGEAALTLYQKGYELALQKGDPAQSYYHGVNIAFLLLVFRDDRRKAAEQAKKVLSVCDECAAIDRDEWLEAARGEAHLIAGNNVEALAAYKKFVGLVQVPWKLSSTYLNARAIAAARSDRAVATELGKVFNDPAP